MFYGGLSYKMQQEKFDYFFSALQDLANSWTLSRLLVNISANIKEFTNFLIFNNTIYTFLLWWENQGGLDMI